MDKVFIETSIAESRPTIVATHARLFVADKGVQPNCGPGASVRSMSTVPGCHCHQLPISSFLKHPCSNNRFIRQQQARLASAQSGSPRISSSKFASGTSLHSLPSNGYKCSAFFKFGKSNEYKGKTC